MNRDAMFGILGGTLLLLAMVGVFYYEAEYYEDRNPPRSVSWPTHEERVDRPGEASGTTTKTETVTIARDNLTVVTFTLRWSDPHGGANDAFRLKVTGPDPSFTGEKSSSTGELVVQFTGLNPIPAPREERGSHEQISARLSEGFTSSVGRGDWKVDITDTAPGDGPIPTQTDPGNAYTLEVRFESYRASW